MGASRETGLGLRRLADELRVTSFGRDAWPQRMPPVGGCQLMFVRSRVLRSAVGGSGARGLSRRG